MNSIYTQLAEIEKNRENIALCTILETKGSTPRKAGSKMIVWEDGRIFGTVGGGTIEKSIIEDAKTQIKLSQAIKKFYNLGDDLGMHCGGKMEVFIEPIISKLKLYVFGAGHIGKSLAKYCPDFGFSVTMIDDRPEVFEHFSFGNAECIIKNFSQAIDELKFDNNTFSVVVTYNHANDEAVVEKIAKKPHKYVGMIGSKTKVALAKKRFLEEKIFTQDELDKIHMPIGIKFNAQTPDEIALSIVAQLIDIKNS
ncbi:MAG TPA: xanthine dehydrogenase [Bacteroidales bacterium]|nr:MAG: hypothetical protein A2W98_13915 [Bacteroidetes bacterium GWF2_33_38]HBF89221.1 xanthine dehydrogenase [Bacteroidales bacterium]